MVDKPKVTGVLLALALAGSLVACSSDSDKSEPETDSQSSSGTEVSDTFPQQDVIVTAVCSPGNGVGKSIIVDGWHPQSWKHVAHTEFRLPDTAVVQSDKSAPGNAVRELCEPQPGPADAGNAVAVRSLFDQDFTKMAVVTEDPETGARHVGYVDRAGKFTDLTGNVEFGETPQEDKAAFSRDGKTVWLSYEVTDVPGESTKDLIASRSLTGDRQAVDQFEVSAIGEDYLIMVGTPSRPVVGSSAHLSPDGKHLLADGQVLELPAGNEGVSTDLVEQGQSIYCSGGTPMGWIDDDTVLCDAEHTAEQRFATKDVGPGLEPGTPIVPNNDHRNYGMVVSPDGQRFAFRSVQGDRHDFFLADTKPGSTPEKIERTGAFATLGDTAVFIDWR